MKIKLCAAASWKYNRSGSILSPFGWFLHVSFEALEDTSMTDGEGSQCCHRPSCLTQQNQEKKGIS